MRNFSRLQCSIFVLVGMVQGRPQGVLCSARDSLQPSKWEGHPCEADQDIWAEARYHKIGWQAAGLFFHGLPTACCRKVTTAAAWKRVSIYSAAGLISKSHSQPSWQDDIKQYSHKTFHKSKSLWSHICDKPVKSHISIVTLQAPAKDASSRRDGAAKMLCNPQLAI